MSTRDLYANWIDGLGAGAFRCPTFEVGLASRPEARHELGGTNGDRHRRQRSGGAVH